MTDLDPSQRLFFLNELDALYDRFDIILIDTGAGISSNVMYFNSAALERLVIVTNEPTSLTDAYALIKVLYSKYHQKSFKVLVNLARSGSEAERIYKSLSLVADKFLGSPSLDYLGWIPYDQLIPKSIVKQNMVMKLHPNAEASKSFMELARRLTDVNEEVFEGDLKFFWRKLLNY